MKIDLGEVEAQERILALEQLMRSPGYLLLAEAMRDSANATYSLMMMSKDAHEMAKKAGAHHAIIQLIDWPQRELEGLKEFLKSEESQP